MIVSKNDIEQCFKYNQKITPKYKNKMQEKITADGWICNSCSSCSSCACSCSDCSPGICSCSSCNSE